MAVRFHEAFVGGFFGFGRTYGAVARIETESAPTLEPGWLDALDRVREWRESRGSKAASISFFFVVPESIADEARSLIGDVLITPHESPKELAGLAIEAAVFDPDGGITFESTIRSR